MYEVILLAIGLVLGLFISTFKKQTAMEKVGTLYVLKDESDDQLYLTLGVNNIEKLENSNFVMFEVRKKNK